MLNVLESGEEVIVLWVYNIMICFIMKISSIIILIVNILKVDSLLCSVCWQTVNILADVT